MKILKSILIFLFGFAAGALALWMVAQNHIELRYYLLEHPTGNQPQVKVVAFIQAIAEDDWLAALGLWELQNSDAGGDLEKRREVIIDELIAADFDLEYKILRTKWWKTCCMPGVVCDSRSAGGARISVQFIDQEGQPFLYKFDDGKHYHLRLSLLDEVYYPPKPIQQPRIPLWCVGIWPKKKSMRRALKCDGVIVEKRNAMGEPEAPAPTDIIAIKAFIEAERQQTTSFDIVVSGKTLDLKPDQVREKLLAFKQAGATWWLEELYDQPEDTVFRKIQAGPLTWID